MIFITLYNQFIYQIYCSPTLFDKEPRKLTQEEFAKSINTKQSVISEYENGLSPIQTAFLYNICIKYEVSADWLIK